MATKRSGYPLPKFHYEVDWGTNVKLGFTEVTGLTFETEVIEYREGSSNTYHKSKQPGLTKYSNLTFKRGTFQGDNDFFTEWKKTFFFQEGKEKFRADMTIKLLNEEHQPIMIWKAIKAWPSKIQSADLKSDANEVAIETMEMVHEGLTLEAK